MMIDSTNVWKELAKLLPDFEKRKEQIAMANAVNDAMSMNEHLICEAGTGIGKSLAYLVPAIQFIKNSEEPKRLIVSTYTKNLQQQLLEHDIPLLQSAGLKFTPALALGSANYLCLRKRDKLAITELQESFIKGKNKEIERLLKWSKETDTGLRAEFEKGGVSKVFNEVARDSDLCILAKCEHFNKCFYRKSREKLKQADVILVNHWLFFAGILPEYHAIVFDEAHRLEDVATLFAGIDISNYTIDYFLRAVEREIGKKAELVRTIREVSDASAEFFSKLLAFLINKSTLRVTQKIGTNFPGKLDRIKETLKTVKKETKDIQKVEEINRYINKCNLLRQSISCFTEQKAEDTVYWIEVARYRDKRKPRTALRSAPINIAEWMQENVFNPDIPIILTSATLTVDKSFDFVIQRIGMEKRKELLLYSSFDYRDNVTVYIPYSGPNPNDEKYPAFIAQQVAELAKQTLPIGGVLVLFTSFKLMNKIYNDVKDKIGAPCLKQGELAKNELIRRFKIVPSVLFGVTSFWQGIDIPGKALSTVIITRLPFEVPDSPITEARAETIAKNGGIPFIEYQLPQAVMQLKQGFGRLIRKKEDFGVVAILDTRIIHKGYGRKFFTSLPLHRRVSNIKQVGDFFEKKLRLFRNGVTNITQI